jgi:Transposase DDE domain
VTAANVADVTMLAAVVDDISPVRTPSGRRRRRPGKLDADKGYDSAANRAWLRRRGITARIARLGIESSARLATSLAGGAGAVVAVVLPAPGGSLGPGFGAVVRVCAVDLHAGLLQPALAR